MKKTFLISLLFSLLIMIPLAVLAEDPPEIKNPIIYDTIIEVVESLTSFVFTLGIVLAPLVFLIGGFVFLTSGGDTNKVQKGKDIMVYAVIGFVIILLVKGLVELIENTLGVKEETVYYFKDFMFLGIINLKRIKRSIFERYF